MNYFQFCRLDPVSQQCFIFTCGFMSQEKNTCCFSVMYLIRFRDCLLQNLKSTLVHVDIRHSKCSFDLNFKWILVYVFCYCKCHSFHVWIINYFSHLIKVNIGRGKETEISLINSTMYIHSFTCRWDRCTFDRCLLHLSTII